MTSYGFSKMIYLEQVNSDFIHLKIIWTNCQWIDMCNNFYDSAYLKELFKTVY